VFDAPREIITSIPGVTFVELAHNKAASLCCGGGGNLQSVDADTAAKITALRVEEIKATGATIVVSACQQCETMLIAAIQKAKLPVRVMDISQLILEAL
jgi:Fe-S oxidoreductase